MAINTETDPNRSNTDMGTGRAGNTRLDLDQSQNNWIGGFLIAVVVVFLAYAAYAWYSNYQNNRTGYYNGAMNNPTTQMNNPTNNLPAQTNTPAPGSTTGNSAVPSAQ